MHDTSLKLTDAEIARMFSDPQWQARFPPILSVEQAAELAHAPVGTVYQWSSRGRLKGCARHAGKRLLIHRDRFVKLLFNDGLIAR